MALTLDDHINGIFAIIWVAIATIITTIFIMRARKYKQPILYYWSIGFVGITFPYYPTIVSYIVALFNENGLTLEQYESFGFPFITITILFFAYVVMELVAKEKQKIIVLVLAVINIAFLIYYYSMVFIDPSSIGVLETPVNISYSGLTLLFSLYTAITFLILGIVLSRKLIQSDNQENKLKGKILLIGFISYTIAIFIDANYVPGIVVIIIRITLISAAIELYFGWVLPGFLKKRFIR